MHGVDSWLGASGRMTLSAGLRLLLFVSSYFPLSVIAYFLLRRESHVLALSALAVGVVGLIGLIVLLRVSKRIPSRQLRIEEVTERDAEAMSYMMTYVIPFLAITGTSQEERIALGIFFLVLAVLYMNSSMLHINPMLNLLRYRIYEIRTEDTIVAVISRRRLVVGQVAAFRRIADFIFLCDDEGHTG